MTTDLLEPMFWSAFGIISFGIITWVRNRLRDRRRRKAKPWRISKTPPKVEIEHQTKTFESLTKPPVRKSTARIGVRRTLKR